MKVILKKTVFGSLIVFQVEKEGGRLKVKDGIYQYLSRGNGIIKKPILNFEIEKYLNDPLLDISRKVEKSLDLGRKQITIKI